MARLAAQKKQEEKEDRKARDAEAARLASQKKQEEEEARKACEAEAAKLAAEAARLAAVRPQSLQLRKN